MIDRCRGRKARGRMAIFAEARGRDMDRILARGADTVMAACTVRRDSEMIEEHREPCAREMTSVAFLLCRRMIRGLTDTLNVVVAG